MRMKALAGYGAVMVAVGIASALITALLMNILERKSEAKNPYVRLVEVNENDTDPQKWGVNWPKQYESYRLTALTTRTRFGGHGGSEALPEQKIERDPWLKRMFLGYAFSIDYRDRRGHAYMLQDQEETKRLTKPQTGSCLHCHASVMPLYRELGGGDALAGLEKTYQMSYQELNAKLHESGHAHPVSCVDCHDPGTMKLRVTRPGFLKGIQALAQSVGVDLFPTYNTGNNVFVAPNRREEFPNNTPFGTAPQNSRGTWLSSPYVVWPWNVRPCSRNSSPWSAV